MFSGLVARFMMVAVASSRSRRLKHLVQGSGLRV